MIAVRTAERRSLRRRMWWALLFSLLAHLTAIIGITWIYLSGPPLPRPEPVEEIEITRIEPPAAEKPKFIDKKTASKATLELHELKYPDSTGQIPGGLPDGKPEPYFLAVALVGAYQEVLGDLHNLYGDTHVVHVSFDDSPGVGDWDLDEVVEGDSVKEVLSYVQYDSEDLIKSMRRDVERAVKAGTMSVPEAQSLLKFYDIGMEGYTYLE